MRWIRKKVNWIAGAAIGGFLLWLVGTVVSLQATQPENVGRLFGKRVSLQAYTQALEAATHQAILEYGDQYRKARSPQALEEQAWERLLFLAEAKRRRIQVSDQEIVHELQGWPLFQTKGQFDPKGYNMVVQYVLGSSPRAFEEEIRQNLTIRKLFDQVIGNLDVTEQQLKEGFHQREDSIKVTTLLFSNESLAREAADACRQQPSQLEKIAKQLNLKPVTSDFFKRTSQIPELGSGDTFDQAFALKVGQVAGPMDSPRGWIVARLEERKPADEEQLATSREALEKELINQKRMRAYFDWYLELLRKSEMKRGSGPQPVTRAQKKPLRNP